jgi:hypothetical protein
MSRGRVGEERGGKEMDGCPLTVILLNSEVVDFTIKVVIKGRTCVLRLLISLVHVHMRGFILVFFCHRGECS